MEKQYQLSNAKLPIKFCISLSEDMRYDLAKFRDELCAADKYGNMTIAQVMRIAMLRGIDAYRKEMRKEGAQ